MPPFIRKTVLNPNLNTIMSFQTPVQQDPSNLRLKGFMQESSEGAVRGEFRGSKTRKLDLILIKKRSILGVRSVDRSEYRF
jgi:hypothetical protein